MYTNHFWIKAAGILMVFPLFSSLFEKKRKAGGEMRDRESCVYVCMHRYVKARAGSEAFLSTLFL